ncbi:terminase small subunit [Dechloromonas sp. ARDL1]|uniref:terminase small subunit n=1 Tax=Dechloromonas sp. ARDL1 TaxID=3322121 RepID=UPI003DA78A27
MSLTPKQEKFAQEVASGKSQADAYRAAFDCARSKPETIQSHASRLMADGKVSARVKELREMIVDRLAINNERILREIARLALFDPRSLFNDDGTPKPIAELDDDTAAAIAGLEVLEEFEGSGKERVFVGYTKKYKIADKNAALEKLCKHLGLYAPQKIEHSGGVVITASPLDENI